MSADKKKKKSASSPVRKTVPPFWETGCKRGRIKNGFFYIAFLLVTTSVIKSRLFDAGYGLMYHSNLVDNDDVLVCTMEGVLKEIGTFKYQKDRR
jgi:hypothetical protein